MMQTFERNFLPTEIQLSSGKAFDYSKVNEHQMELSDICKSLSMVARFNGHTKYHLSVAQHSIMVGSLMEADGCREEEILYGFLHDASESVYCDLPQPLKQYFKGTNLLQDYVRLEDEFIQQLYANIGIFPPSKEVKEKVKIYDILSLEFEMANCLDNTKIGHNLIDIEGKNLNNLDPKFEKYREFLEPVLQHNEGDFAYGQTIPWDVIMMDVIRTTLANMITERIK